MSLTQLQNNEAIQKDIKDLSRQIEHLVKLYEQYFLGLIREEPLRARSEVKKILNNYHGVAIRNASLKFQLQQCVARYNTFSTYWDRILREMEEGTYKRDLFKTNLHEKERKEKMGTVKPAQQSKPKDVYENLFNQYKELKKQIKQDSTDLSFDTFKKQLAGKIGNDVKNPERFSFKIVKENKTIKIKLQKKGGKGS